MAAEGRRPGIEDAVNVAWSGIWLGSAYAFVAIGLVAAFRAARIVNLAIGSIFVFAGMMAAELQERGLSMGLAAGLAVAAGLGIAVAQERLILRPLSTSPPVTILLGTLSVAVLLSGVSAVLFGRDPVTASGFGDYRQIELSIWRANWDEMLLVVISAALAAVVWVALERSFFGRAVGAAGFDSVSARMIGINVWRLRAVAMALAGVAAGIGGVLFLPLGVFDSSQGLNFTLFGFVAAAVAGYNSVLGAVGAAWGFGIVSALGTFYISSAFSQAVTFGALVVLVVGGQSLSWIARRA